MKDFSRAVFERAAKDPEFARELQGDIGAQIVRAEKAEAQQQKEFLEAVEIMHNKDAKIECLELQIAEAVRECERIAKETQTVGPFTDLEDERQYFIPASPEHVAKAIRSRWPEYFKEDA